MTTSPTPTARHTTFFRRPSFWRVGFFGSRNQSCKIRSAELIINHSIYNTLIHRSRAQRTCTTFAHYFH